MQSISVMRDYLWLRAMDSICWLRGHSVTSFPKGRFCLRCYKVEGVDFLSLPQQPTSAIGRLVRRFWHSLRGHQMELLRCEVAEADRFWWEHWACSCGREQVDSVYVHPDAGLLRVGRRARFT